MTPHKFTYPKVVATRPGPSAYERRTKAHDVAPRDAQDDRRPEPRRRRKASPER